MDARDYRITFSTIDSVILRNMRRKNPRPLRCPRWNYSNDQHSEALRLVKTGVSIRKAAEQCGIPESTLRTNINGRTIRGRSKPTVLAHSDEESLVNHIAFMAECGYGLTCKQVLKLASELLLELTGEQRQLGRKWGRLFMRRWPQLRVVKPRKLALNRAKATTPERLERYYTELKRVMDDHEVEQPSQIYNIDESGFNCEHSPPKVVSGSKCTPAITSCRSATITVIACGCADGTSLPPFFILKGKRELPAKIREDCLPGSKFTVSDSGWSNGQIFRKFFQTHFLPSLGERNPDEYTLLLYDGHKSHITVPLIEEARKNNVILFILPPHTSHLLQPLDVGCFGPMKQHFNHACAKYLAANPGMALSRHNICQPISEAYLKAMTSSNLQAAFRKTGIVPYDKEAVDIAAVTRPSQVTVPCDEGRRAHDGSRRNQAEAFLLERFPVVQPPKVQSRKRKAPSYEAGGIAITENNVFLKIYMADRQGSSHPPSTSSVPLPPSLPARPSSPGSSSEDSDELCCQCGQSTPPKEQSPGLIINWAQCDHCDHWVHLACSVTTEVEEHQRFECPCCDGGHEP